MGQVRFPFVRCGCPPSQVPTSNFCVQVSVTPCRTRSFEVIWITGDGLWCAHLLGFPCFLRCSAHCWNGSEARIPAPCQESLSIPKASEEVLWIKVRGAC